MIAPLLIVHDPDVLPAVRELFSSSLEAADCGAEAIARLLYAKRFLSYRPATVQVEAVLEVLRLDSGEVAA